MAITKQLHSNTEQIIPEGSTQTAQRGNQRRGQSVSHPELMPSYLGQSESWHYDG